MHVTGSSQALQLHCTDLLSIPDSQLLQYTETHKLAFDKLFKLAPKLAMDSRGAFTVSKMLKTATTPERADLVALLGRDQSRGDLNRCKSGRIIYAREFSLTCARLARTTGS